MTARCVWNVGGLVLGGWFVACEAGTGRFYQPEMMGPGVGLLDYDNDGDFDLYMVQGGELGDGAPLLAPPEEQPPGDRLFRNDLDTGPGGERRLRFTDVTDENAIAARGYGMGVAAGDYDNDGWPDLFVANDQQENQLWINQRDGTFRNRALLWGTALGATGVAKADMGVDAGDFDNDGDEDIFITELSGQGSTLYVNDGGMFRDRSAVRGIRGASLPYTGFGAGWLDVDNDGDTDVLIANGAGPVRLLVNEVGERRHWIGLRLVGRAAPRDMLGARVEVVLRDGSRRWCRARADGSYASASDPRVIVGLGESAGSPRVRVTWPGGRVEEWADLPPDRYTTLTEGDGRQP